MRTISALMFALLFVFAGVDAMGQRQPQQQQQMVIEATPRPNLFNRLFRRDDGQQTVPQMAPAQQNGATRDASTAGDSQATRRQNRRQQTTTKATDTQANNEKKPATENAKKAEEPKAADAATDKPAEESKKAEEPKKAEETKKPAETAKPAQKAKMTAAEKKAEEDLAKERQRLEELVGKAKQAATMFVHVANKGLYSNAQQMLIPAQQEYYLGSESVTRGVSFKALLDDLTKDGTVKRMLITCNVRGEGCRVNADLTYKTGQTLRAVFDMILIADKWRVMILSPEKNTITTTPVPTVPFEETAPAKEAASADDEESSEPVATTPTPAAVETAAAVQTPAADATPAASAADVIASLAKENSDTSAPATTATNADAPWRR